MKNKKSIPKFTLYDVPVDAGTSNDGGTELRIKMQGRTYVVAEIREIPNPLRLSLFDGFSETLKRLLNEELIKRG